MDAVPYLQQLIAAAGDTLSLPAGTYELDTALLVQRPVTIIGAGQGQTTLLRASPQPINLLSTVALKNLTIDSGGLSSAVLMNAPNCILDTVEVKNFGLVGIAAMKAGAILRHCWVHQPNPAVPLTMGIWRDAGASDSESLFTADYNVVDGTQVYATGGHIIFNHNQVRHETNPGGGQVDIGNSATTNTIAEVNDNFVEFGGNPMTGGLELGGGSFDACRNVIRNHGLSGIGIGHNVVKALLEENVISNSGQNTSERHVPACRSAIYVGYGARNLTIMRNRAFDDQAVKTQTYGIVFTPVPTIPDPRFEQRVTDYVRCVGNFFGGNFIGPSLDCTSGASDVQIYGNL
jgi:hypothetical protein